MKMVTHVGRMHAGMVEESLCVCRCVHMCIWSFFCQAIFGCQSGMLLSQDSNGVLGNWEVVISREAPLYSGLYYSCWLRLLESNLECS